MICDCIGCTSMRLRATTHCLREGLWEQTTSGMENWIPLYENRFETNLLWFLERGGWGTV